MDLFLRILLIALLFFVPFSFAGAEPWAFSILQGALCVLLAGIFLDRKTLHFTPLFTPVLYTLGVLILYTLLQCVAPQTLLNTPTPYPATLMRLYSLEHLSYFVTYLAWVFVVMQLADTSVQIRRGIFWTGICAVLICLCALCLPKGQYIHAFTGVMGGFGPFFNRNHGGIFLAGCAVLCLGWLCAAQPAHDSETTNKSFLARQIWGTLIVFSIAISAIFSRSRGGMLSLTVGMFVFFVCCARFVPTLWKKRAKWLFITLMCFGTLAYWAGTHMQQINTFAERRAVQDTSIETRVQLYRTAKHILHDYPLWGIGVGAMPVVVPSYLKNPINAYVERLHSDWLEMLVGLGYVGSILVLIGLFWFAMRLLCQLEKLNRTKQIRLAALFATALAICTGAIADFPFFIPATALLFFWAIGLACASSFWKGHIRTWQPAGWVRILILLLFLSACFIPLQKTRAWRLFTFGRNLKTETRIQYYEKGLSLFPSPRFAVQLGNAYYNASLHTKDPQEQFFFRSMAQVIAVDYLNKYPKDKELSRLYKYSRFPTQPAR